MKWDVLSQLLAALLVSVVVSILVLRYATQLAHLSTPGALLLSFGLLVFAGVLALGPSVLSALLPSAQVITRFRRGALRIATVGLFNLAAIAFTAAAIIVVSTSSGREDALYRYLGPMLAIIGVGSILAFASGLIMSGVSSFSIWSILNDLLFPFLMLVIAVMSARQSSDDGIALWRLGLSTSAGGGALNYAFGFIHGYFDGTLEYLGQKTGKGRHGPRR